MSGLQPDGLPHSDISGSIPVCSSPELFAAYHVLLRLRKPRHPPYALLAFFSLLAIFLIPQKNCSPLKLFYLLSDLFRFVITSDLLRWLLPLLSVIYLCKILRHRLCPLASPPSLQNVSFYLVIYSQYFNELLFGLSLYLCGIALYLPVFAFLYPYSALSLSFGKVLVVSF